MTDTLHELSNEPMGPLPWRQRIEQWRLQWHLWGAQYLEARPMIFQVAAVAVALIGYVVPLLFPIASMMLALQLVAAVQESGLMAFSQQLDILAWLAATVLLSVSLWRMQVGEPEGESVTRQQVPALYDQVDEIRGAFQAPTITDIHLSALPELTVHRVPQSGYPFGFRHVLVAGLPTLQCLTHDQFKCLLAACLGDLSAMRTDVSGWITQLARTWQQYRRAVTGRWTPAALLYRFFLAWYMPLLAAVAKRLDKRHRLQCDHYALEIASDDLVVDMMAGEVIMQRFLQEVYWPTVFKTAEHSSTPNFKVFRNLETVFRSRVSDEDIQLWVREAYVGKWVAGDSDPGLKIRLQEIGHGEIRYIRSDLPAAAQALLGASYQWVIDRCDVRWAEEHREEWAARHAKTRHQYSRLDTLRDILQRYGLRDEEAMEYAALVKRYGKPEEAMEAYETILELNPEDARIHFGVGKFMLSQKDARGVKILERAMALDKRYVDPACRLISGFSGSHKAPDNEAKHTLKAPQGKGKRSVA